MKQVPNGLAGAILVGHEPVPAGVSVAQEQVMMFNDTGTIGLSLNGKSFPATPRSWPSSASGLRSTT